MTNMALDQDVTVEDLVLDENSRDLDARLVPEAAGSDLKPDQRTVSDARIDEVAFEDRPVIREAVRIPQIVIHAFCGTSSVITAIEAASADRLMSRTNVTVHKGGIEAAIRTYEKTSSPNLILIENQSSNEEFLGSLDRLAQLCTTGTRVFVIGHVNDVAFYRELVRRGVSEYVPAPVAPASLIELIGDLYKTEASSKIGKLYAFIGARGGVGSSILAQNVGLMLSRQMKVNVALADMDMPFGTAGLNLDVNEGFGVADAIQDIARLDEVLFERLLTRHSERFNLLSAPAALERPYDIRVEAATTLLDVARSSVPMMILDMPHLWTEWAMEALTVVDDIVITTTPDIAGLRNAKNIVTYLRQRRPHDAPPKLVLNKVGTPKRPEVAPAEFAKATGLKPIAVIPYDARLFGTAENEGRMLMDISAKAPATKAVTQIVQVLAAGKPSAQRHKRSMSLKSLLEIIGRRGQ